MGIIFAQTDITPFPPKESIGIIKLSFPDKTLKSVSLVLFITCAIFSKEGFASFIATILGIFESFTIVSTEMSTPVLDGTL